MQLPKNYELPHGYTMQNINSIETVTNTNIIICQLTNGRFLVLKPYGLHGMHPCTFLWRGRVSNRTHELSRIEKQNIQQIINNK